MNVSNEIDVWMNHNCVRGNTYGRNRQKSKKYETHEGVARLYPTYLFILASPYQNLNNHLFASFTHFWNLIDDEYVGKGGLAPYNLAKSPYFDTSIETNQSDEVETFENELEEKQSLLANGIDKLFIKTSTVDEGTIRQAFLKSYLGSILPLEIINLVLFYESVIHCYAGKGFSSALCGAGKVRSTLLFPLVRSTLFFSLVRVRTVQTCILFSCRTKQGADPQFVKMTPCIKHDDYFIITMFHQMQTDMKHLFSRISEAVDISYGETGCILNIDLLAYRRVISPQNWMVHDFYEKWMDIGLSR